MLMCVEKRRKNKKGTEKVNLKMNNYEIEAFAKKLDLTNFRGVFCRDTLPQKSERQECGIFN